MFWGGQTGRPPPPLAGLPAGAKAALARHGWREAAEGEELDATGVAVSYGRRSAADVPACAPLPLVRQLPKSRAELLDDKASLADGEVHCHIPVAFRGDNVDDELLESVGGDGAAWFVKHRRGAQGKSVQRCRSLAAARELLRGRHDPGEYVVQREVGPPLLLDGRRVCLRAHALVLQRPGETAAAFLHRTVVALEHATKWSADADEPGAHVQQRGKGHTTPYPLAAAPWEPGVRERAQADVEASACSLFASFRGRLIPEDKHPRVTLMHVFGLDFAVAEDGRAQLVEANAWPALGWGTMSAVPRNVFDELLEDMLFLAVLPAVEGAVPTPGGFAALPVEL